MLEFDGPAFPQRTERWIVDGQSRRFVDGAKHRTQRLALCFRLPPTRERFGHGIEKHHTSFAIGADHAVADAGKRDPQPLPLFAKRALDPLPLGRGVWPDLRAVGS